MEKMINATKFATELRKVTKTLCKRKKGKEKQKQPQQAVHEKAHIKKMIQPTGHHSASVHAHIILPIIVQ